MFCDNCGFKLSDDATFCDHCGARITPAPSSANNYSNQNANSGNAVKFSGNYNNNNNNYGDNYNGNNANYADNFYQQQQNDHTDIPNPVTPKAKSKKPIIIAASVAGVIAITAVGFAASKPIRNSINKAVMSPEKYFNHVVGKGTSDGVEEVSSLLTNLKSPNFGAEGKISIEAGEALYDFVDEYGGSEASDYISWFENGAINYNLATNESTFSADLGLNINNADLINASFALDAEEGYLYLTIPQISEKAIRGEFDTTEYLAAVSQMSDSTEQLEALMNVIPDQKVTEKLLNKYIECVIKSVDDIDESSEKLSIEGTSVKATVLTANIDGETFANILTNVLTEVRDDKEIKKIITNISELEMYEDMGMDYDLFVESIDEILDEGFEDFESSDESIELDFYVNNKGDIIGFGFEEEGVEFLCASIVKGKNFASTISVESEGQTVEFSGSGKISGNKKTGEYKLSVMGFEVLTISLDGVDSKKLEEGTIVGTITLEPGSGLNTFTAMLDSEISSLISDLKLEIKGTDKGSKLSLYSGEDLYIALGLEGKTTDNSKVNIPSDYMDSEDASDMMDFADAAEDYVTGDLIDKLEEINVPDDIIDELGF